MNADHDRDRALDQALKAALGRRDDAYDLLARSGRTRTSDRPMEQWHHAVSMSWWHAAEPPFRRRPYRVFWSHRPIGLFMVKT